MQASLEKNFQEIVAGIQGRDELCLVYDKNVAYIAKPLLTFLKSSFSDTSAKIFSLGIDAGENRKSLVTVSRICAHLLKHDFGRNAILLSLGGGVISDITGFAASIYKRGIAYANLPTTLLSMVDAGVGGKTGVNFREVKNILGTFWQPEFTYNISSALETLPQRELKSGSAELLKTFLLSNALKYEKSVEVLSSLQSLSVSQNSDSEGKSRALMSQLCSLANEAANIKKEIVLKDPTEKGLRRILNLGHTLGHALETRSGFAHSHGECVAVGIIASARLSEKLGIASPGLADKLSKDFLSCGLPTQISDILEDSTPLLKKELLSFIGNDKKVSGKTIKEPLIERTGSVKIVEIDPRLIVEQ